MEAAVEEALIMARWYATGTRNYTTETWKYGSMEIVSEECEIRQVRPERASLHVVGGPEPLDRWARRATKKKSPSADTPS
jgi:hypothetical protein